MFFGTQVIPPAPVPEPSLTHIYDAERTDDGIVFSLKCLETQTDPLVALNFRDYTINNLILAGINPETLKIKLDKNMKMGHDDDIEKFNKRVDAMVDKLFNSK